MAKRTVIIAIFAGIGGLIAIFLLPAIISNITFGAFSQGEAPARPSNITPEYQETDIEMAFFKKTLGMIKGQTADDPPKTFVASVSIGYEKGSTAIQAELISKTEQLKDTILKFLGRKSTRELITGNFPRLEEELKNKLNDTLLRSGQIHKVLIHELQTF